MMMPDVRPIDANALDITDLLCYYGGNCDLDKIEEWVFDAPTLDYAPVRHGEWLPQLCSYGTFKCSICGWCIPYSEDSTLDARNFCPNCGARMDGGQHDH